MAFVLTTVCGIGALVLIWVLYPKPFDYQGAIRSNFVFLQVRPTSLQSLLLRLCAISFHYQEASLSIVKSFGIFCCHLLHC